MKTNKSMVSTLKPVVVAVSMAIGQQAFACETSLVVNSIDDPTGDLTTFEEAMAATADCGEQDISITFAENLAGQIISHGDYTYGLYGGNNYTITGPQAERVIIQKSSSSYELFNIAEAGTLKLSNVELDGQQVVNRAHSAINVSAADSSLEIDNVKIHGFYGYDVYGAAIRSEYGGPLTIRNSEISDNKTYRRGGGVHAFDSSLEIIDSVFDGNLAEGDISYSGGGAISFSGEYGSAELSISGSTFRNNRARNYGGAIYQSTSRSVVIEDSIFENNSVTAASNEYGTGAAAEAHGGAITLDRSTGVTVSGSQFNNNSATNYGGAMYIGRSGRSGNIQISDTTFTGNQAIYSAGESTLAHGGAIYVGAAVGDPVTISLSDTSIVDGGADGNGGGVYIQGAGVTFIIDASRITNNSADDGGGIYNENLLTVRNSIIEKNSANSAFGGGIFTGNSEMSTTTLINSTFFENRAVTSGDEIYTQAGGATNMANVLVVNNNVEVVDDCFGALSKNVTNWVQDGTCSSMFIGDPELFDPENGDLRPIPSSSAVNAGDNSESPETDFNGTIRPQELYADIGAYEYNPDGDFDGDGINDPEDAFPLDDSETLDTDGDGIGNNTDTDDDNDGVADSDDAFPLDDSETIDTDGDGIGNNSDVDDDGDGVADSDDAFPLDDSETLDTDGDGTGNNSDVDDDGDGVADSDDAFPLDDSETLDTDGDGIGNNSDTDDDGDGVADSDDAFPLDASRSEESISSGGGAMNWLWALVLLFVRRVPLSISTARKKLCGREK
ncbi:thrombospondin type 3 repeat-containing protein [Aliikangiella sp. G2MR2-5]|uniref:thrombospondin type 3 repeat-containing protein n=1 Tax=Aliikangiella sp. G2MR2-5 TaxID=2788943 RepID=UPI001AEF34C0|nr:thrombospondin type 3 repeat-containing protein [Aliikangiella sp. G2MR2-5]